jgi:hypothetical protein
VSAPPLRLGFATDFHSGPTTHPAVVERACRILADASPDVLLLAGDFVELHARHIDRLIPMLSAIPAPLGRFAVLGNHDLMGDDAYVAERLESGAFSCSPTGPRDCRHHTTLFAQPEVHLCTLIPTDAPSSSALHSPAAT